MFQLQLFFCSIVTNGTALQLCRDTSLSQELHYCSQWLSCLEDFIVLLLNMKSKLEGNFTKKKNYVFFLMYKYVDKGMKPILKFGERQMDVAILTASVSNRGPHSVSIWLVRRNSFYFSYYSKYMNLLHNHILQIYVLFLYILMAKQTNRRKRSVFNETHLQNVFEN